MNIVSEVLRCREDPVYFIDRYCSILDYGSQGVVPFRLYDYQVESIRVLQESKKVITLKGRQLGFSWLYLAYGLWKCMFNPYSHGLLIGVDEEFGYELLSRIRFMHRNLPDWLRVPEGLISKGRMSFPGLESVIEAETSSSTAGTGGTFSFVLLDEWAKHKYADETWLSVKPAAEFADLVICSTAYGVGNLFHRQWTDACAGRNSLRPVFVPWNAKPGRDAEWYRTELMDLGSERKMKQEHPSEPNEAFIQGGASVFDLSRANKWEDAPISDIPDILAEIRGLKVYEMPVPGMTYGFGWDTSEGIVDDTLTTDFAAGVGICRETGRQVLAFREKIDPESLAVVIDRVTMVYDNSVVGVERNNHGYTCLQALEALGTPNLYKHSPYEARVGGKAFLYKSQKKTLGWVTNNRNKALMIDQLQAALFRGELTVRCDDLWNELYYYQMVVGGKTKAARGHFDDCVIACAIAWQMLSEISTWTPESIAYTQLKKGTNFGRS